MKRVKASELHQRVPRLKDVPDFQSDQEELEWLDANHERLAKLAEKHGVLVKFAEREPTQQISIRLPISDLAYAKRLAKKQKVKYQSVLKQALRVGLRGATGTQ